MSILIAWDLGANFGHRAPRQYWRSSCRSVYFLALCPFQTDHVQGISYSIGTDL